MSNAVNNRNAPNHGGDLSKEKQSLFLRRASAYAILRQTGRLGMGGELQKGGSSLDERTIKAKVSPVREHSLALHTKADERVKPGKRCPSEI